jgi:hypothetical protein
MVKGSEKSIAALPFRPLSARGGYIVVFLFIPASTWDRCTDAHDSNRRHEQRCRRRTSQRTNRAEAALSITKVGASERQQVLTGGTVVTRRTPF